MLIFSMSGAVMMVSLLLEHGCRHGGRIDRSMEQYLDLLARAQYGLASQNKAVWQ